MTILHQHEVRAEIRRVTGAIGKVFAVEGDLAEADVEVLHNQLVTCIESVNARLRSCDDLLSRGLRQEAIQDCEVEPNVLDLVTELDMPEWAAWADYVKQFGIPPQPDLLIAVAAELNAAYTKAESLDELLRLHRLHALARSPLATRLAILRRVAERDAASSVWKDDVKSYERARVQQLENEFRQFQSANDLEGLSEMKRELSTGNWLTEPPKSLVERVLQSHQRLLEEDARKRLKNLEKQINAAFSEFDLSKARLARVEWDRLAQVAQLSVDDELSAQVRAAFEWLDHTEAERQRQIEFQHAAATLEDALDSDSTDRTEIVRMFAAVERFNEPIPERLHRRVDERLRTIEVTARRRGWLLMLSLFTAVVILGVIATLAIMSQMRRHQLAEAGSHLEQLLTEGKAADAVAYEKTILETYPYLRDLAQMQKLHVELQSALDKERGRKQHFAALLKQARSLGLDVATYESFTEALQQIAKAEDVAIGDHELVEVTSLKGEILQRQSQLQRQIDDQFQADVAVIVKSTKSIDGLTDVEVHDLLREAEVLQKRARVTRGVRDGGNLPLVMASLNDAIKRRKDDFGKDQALESLRQSIGQPPRYASALRNYVKLAPNGKRSSDFQSVLDLSLKAHTEVQGWNVLAGEWNDLSLHPDPAYGVAAQKILGKLSTKYSDFPGVKSVLALNDYVASIASRSNRDGIAELRTIINNPMFDMNYVQSDSQNFYFTGEPEITNVSLRAKVSQDVRNPNDEKERAFAFKSLKTFPNEKYFDKAPHAKFAARARRLLDPANKVTYEHRLCGLIYLLFRDPEIDPILRCGLLQVILAEANLGSTILAAELASFEQDLTTTDDLSDVNWVSTDDPVVNQVRERTKRLLDNVYKRRNDPTLSDNAQLPGHIYKKLIEPQVAAAFTNRPKLQKLVWVGALLKDTEDKWHCYLDQSASHIPESKLLVRDASDHVNIRFVAVGSYADGTAILDPAQESQLVEGQLVYVLNQ